MDQLFAKPVVIQLLVEVADSEREVEIVRQTLKENIESDSPELFFSVADRVMLVISLEKLAELLEEKGISFRGDYLNRVFNQIDEDRDGKVNFKEFKSYIQPKELSYSTVKRSTMSPSKIRLDSKLCLAKLIEKEMNLLAKIDDICSHQLNNGSFFSITDSFTAIDIDNKGFITVADIFNFVKQEEQTFTMTKAERCFRRITHPADSKIILQHWRNYLASKVHHSKSQQPLTIPKTLNTSDLMQTSARTNPTFQPPTISRFGDSKQLSPNRSTRPSTALKAEIYDVFDDSGKKVGEEVVRYQGKGIVERDFMPSPPREKKEWVGPKVERKLYDSVHTSELGDVKDSNGFDWRQMSSGASTLKDKYESRQQYNPAVESREQYQYRVEKEEEYLSETLVNNTLVRHHYERHTESVADPISVRNESAEKIKSKFRQFSHLPKQEYHKGFDNFHSDVPVPVRESKFGDFHHFPKNDYSKGFDIYAFHKSGHSPSFGVLTHIPSNVYNKEFESLHTKSHQKPSSQFYQTEKDEFPLHLTTISKKKSVGENIYMSESSLIKYFRHLFEVMRDLEERKIELAIRHDFTVVDLFTLADRCHRTHLSLKDLQAFVDKLFPDGLGKPTISQLKMLFFAYDKDGDQTISFEEFSSMICPVYNDIKSLLVKRSARGLSSLDDFNVVTLRSIRNLFITLVQAERSLDGQKKALETDELKEFYRSLDVLNSGKAGPRALTNMLLGLGINVSYQDILLCIDRFDLNSDGKINFKEFLIEMSPQRSK